MLDLSEPDRRARPAGQPSHAPQRQPGGDGRGRVSRSGTGAPRRLDAATVLRSILLGTLLAFLTSTVLLVDLLPSQRIILDEGDVSPIDILAPTDLTYTSAIRTQQAQETQARSVQDIFDPPNASVARQQQIRAQQILEYISTVRQDTYATQADKVRWIAAIPDVGLQAETINSILAFSEEDWQEVKDETERVLLSAMRGEIRESQLSDLRRRLPTLISYGLTESQAAVVQVIVGGLVKANTLFNAARTEEARQRARESTPPVSATIRQGEAIVRAGDRVTALDIEELDAFGLRQKAMRWQVVLGTVLFSIIAASLFEFMTFRIQPALWTRRRPAIVVSAVVALFVILSKLMLPATDGIVPYLYPLPALSIVLSILFGPALGIGAGLIVAMIGTFVVGGALQLTVYLFAGTIVGALAVGRAERLADFFRVGLAVAATNAAVLALFGLIMPDQDTLKVAIDALAGIVMGGVAASLSLAVFFALSALLDIITPFQLMELSRPTQPLFRLLMLNAPGTYHHTLLVANMAEEAANRIGADGLLTRVGAYYHDVGKTVRPYFFTENRVGEQDPHAGLDPQTSAQIIISHVQDGLDLADKHRLPSAIRAFIPEHQGTALVLSFYRMAVKAAGAEGQDVPEEDFRYRGPKPQSRETAVVMLADTCEARVRSAKPSSVDEIDQILREAIKAKRDAGELDECDLTLRDLGTIQSAFLDVLQGVFHPRVQYPEPVKVKGPDGQEIMR